MSLWEDLCGNINNFTNLNVDSPVVDDKKSLEFSQDSIWIYWIEVRKSFKSEYFRQVVGVIVDELDEFSDFLLVFDIFKKLGQISSTDNSVGWNVAENHAAIDFKQLAFRLRN